MKKFFVLLLIFAVVISIFFYSSFDIFNFNISKFPGADVSVISTLKYKDVFYGYNSEYNSDSLVTKTYETSTGSIYKEYRVTNNFACTVNGYIVYIVISGNGLNDIINQLNNGSLVIRIPYNEISISLLMNDSYEIVKGDITDKYNSISRWLNSGYDLVNIYYNGSYNIDLPSYLEFDDAVNSFLNSTEFAFIPVSNDIDYRLSTFYENNLYGSDIPFTLYSGSFNHDFKLVDLSGSNGLGYINEVIFNINQLGDPPVLPDVDFGDQPLLYIASYFSWIVKEIVYLIKFMRCFTLGAI